jgi:hypothetical protein
MQYMTPIRRLTEQTRTAILDFGLATSFRIIARSQQRERSHPIHVQLAPRTRLRSHLPPPRSLQATRDTRSTSNCSRYLALSGRRAERWNNYSIAVRSPHAGHSSKTGSRPSGKKPGILLECETFTGRSGLRYLAGQMVHQDISYHVGKSAQWYAPPPPNAYHHNMEHFLTKFCRQRRENHSLGQVYRRRSLRSD